MNRRSILQMALIAAAGGADLTRFARAEAQPAGARSDTVIKAGEGREVRVSSWPAVGKRRGVILFSHGALSAPEKYERIIGPWNAAGFDVRAPLHVDSTDHPDHAKYGMLDSWRARLEDMRALANSSESSNYVAAGHSYGGLVALTLGGVSAEVPPGMATPLRDVRATAVVAFSPPGLTPGLVTTAGLATLAVPTFIQTGDHDVPYNSKDGRWEGHLAAYDAAPAGDKYALVLEGVDHYFGGLICDFNRPGPTQDVQLTEAVALSTIFMDAYFVHAVEAQRVIDHALSPQGPVRLSRR